jgi:hypothetical protein
LHIPVFRNLIFGPKIPFLTGFLRISFFPVFSREIFHRNAVLEGVAGISFFCFYRTLFAGISVRQEFLYLFWTPPESGGFLRIPVPPNSCLA